MFACCTFPRIQHGANMKNNSCLVLLVCNAKPKCPASAGQLSMAMLVMYASI